MFMHPFVTAFMVFWLSGVGFGAWSSFTAQHAQDAFSTYVPPGIFVFGIGLAIGGFFPEAIKAKRILAAVLSQQPKPPFNKTSADNVRAD